MTQTDTPELDAAGSGSPPDRGERLALAAATDEAFHGGAGHAHPTAGHYVVVALILGVLTGIEVWLSYADIGHTAQTLLLIGLMILKFALVVMYFMHLRYDRPIFRRLFVTGLVLAIAVFLVVLLAEHADLNHSTESPDETEQPAGGE
jgi:caa(3)-type oxidase subunit IV